MGLLSKGTPLEWESSKQHHAYVKHHGILQFLAIFHAQKNRADDNFLWGDEVEHLLLRIDPNTKKVQLSLRAAELIETLEEMARKPADAAATPNEAQSANFLPEYGRFMIEATPSRPYGGFTADLRMVEHNMRARRRLIEKILQPQERLITLTVFPLLGVGDFAYCSQGPVDPVQGRVADSDYISDTIIGAHPRFATLSRNIRTRRGARVDIRVPLFQDENTARDMPKENERERAAIEALLAARDPTLPPHAPRPDLDHSKEIHMDAMAFGMGNCCLQVTFQTRSIGEARHLYDHLAVFSPIMLALTAASPFFRGRVADIDARWTVISQSVDDRTKVERGEANNPDGTPAVEINACQCAPANPASLPSLTIPAAGASSSSASSSDAAPARVGSPPLCDSCGRCPQRLYKSRYDSISTYLSLESDFKTKYNDLKCEIDPTSYSMLLNNGVDELLSRHVAHLFVRDPLVIYDEHIQLDDQKSSDHFENIQSTNWQTVRFKPPTPGSTIGWRVEFRTMEVQLTDFENAAFTVFIALVSRTLLYFNLNFYIPLSKVDENLARAHKRDAVLDEKFFWRKNVKVCGNNKPAASPTPADASASSSSSAPAAASASDDDDDSYAEMSIRDIFLGSPEALNEVENGSKTQSQPGLLNLVRTYLDMIECDALTRKIVDAYLDLISARCTGELMTAAAWLRKFVSVHPAYAHNSLLNQEIVFDMVESCNQIVKGTLDVPQLLGVHNNLEKIPARRADGQSIEIDASPSIELKGARKASTVPASASASSAATDAAGATGTLDLTEKDCCNKLKRFLLPYLQQASTLPSMGSRSSSSTNMARMNSAESLSASSASPTTPEKKPNAGLWLSPSPQ